MSDIYDFNYWAQRTSEPEEDIDLSIPLNDPFVQRILRCLWDNFEITQRGSVSDRTTKDGGIDDWECALATRFYELKKKMAEDES